MKTDIKQITIYYNPAINKHKKTIAHAKSIGEVASFTFYNMTNAYNVWTTIYQSMEKDPCAIFDKSHENYEKLGCNEEMEFDSWYKIVTQNKDMIVAPIAVRGKEVVVCVRQTEIYKLMDSTRPDRYLQESMNGTLKNQPLKENPL